MPYYFLVWEINGTKLNQCNKYYCNTGMCYSTCGVDGLWFSETKEDCYRRCILSGDPHVTSYDNHDFTFEGDCAHTLSKYIASGNGIK